ncbi:OmpH family outer membrane protein [Rickettsiella grylli]|uniref:Outer membrane protein n=1 Tax=Rickettsiella grylli TaxID=59196 RepID=A8PM66_9COXI|nr:OmpH family outer membrane protein [Rickettsiella grylli]EDP46986.1 outer membrane protein [Rickettsiella grylli]
MNKICLVSILTIMTGLLTLTAQAEEIKLAVVDMQAVLQRAPQIAKINDALTRQFKGRQDSIMKAQNELQKEASNLQKNAAVMKADERSVLENKVMTDQNKVKSMIAAFQKDLSKKQSESLHSFSQELDGVVNKVATQSGYDVVLQKGSTLYAKNNLDITQQVLDALKKT